MSNSSMARNRSRDKESVMSSKYQKFSKKSFISERSLQQSLTPLTFVGSEDAIIPERVIEHQIPISKKEEKKTEDQTEEENKDPKAETGMTVMPNSEEKEEDLDDIEWKVSQQEIDRNWYDSEESGQVNYGKSSIFSNQYESYDSQKFREEEELKKKMKFMSPLTRSKFNSVETDKWEMNRMKRSGAIKINEDPNKEAMEEDENKVVVTVHNIKPPFLDGTFVYSKQIEPVVIVRDPNSDMAQFARKGSAILKFIRERNDRTKMREKFWELAGSKMGNILQVENPSKEIIEPEEKVNEDGTVDYKSENQYLPLVNKKIEAVSDFAKFKTIEEQRQFLPIYAVNDEILNLIRLNKMYALFSYQSYYSWRDGIG